MTAYTLTPLSYYRLIKVSGSDAQQFLQNQLSNDIKQLSAQRSQLSSYSSAKGMMFASLRVLQYGDNYLLRIAADIADAVQKRLSLFVLRDDVQLTLADDLHLFGLSDSGDQACTSSLLEQLGLAVPQAVDDVTGDEQIQVVRCLSATGEERFELISGTAAADRLEQACSGDENDYLADQIRSGEALVTQASYEQFVAQHLNLQLINGVSFKKGCYPGQEYIARNQYRNKVRSRCYLISSPEPVKAGDRLFQKDKARDIGQIINAAQHQGKYVALAVIRKQQAAAQDIALDGGHAVQVLELPYAVEGDEDQAL